MHCLHAIGRSAFDPVSLVVSAEAIIFVCSSLLLFSVWASVLQIGCVRCAGFKNRFLIKLI